MWRAAEHDFVTAEKAPTDWEYLREVAVAVAGRTQTPDTHPNPYRFVDRRRGPLGLGRSWERQTGRTA